MKKYLYLIKKAKIKSWLKFWLLTKDQVKYILSEILEGFSFNLQNTVKKRFKIFNIFGNSVQNGTPTPSNPVEIESVADDVNLLENMTIYNSNHYISPLLKLNSGTYTFNYTGDSAAGIYIRKNDGSNPTNGTVVAQKYNTNNITFSISETGNYYIHLYSMTIWEQLTMNNPKLQKGTVATPYSPYNYGTFTIDFEGQTENYNYTFITEPLRSLPNGVRDSLEDDGIHRRISEIVFDGSNDENWAINGTHEGYGIVVSNVGGNHNTSVVSSGFSDKLIISKQQSVYIGEESNIFATLGGNVSKIYIRINNTITSVELLRQYLQNNPIKIQYQLAEEIIEPYTEEQQAEYDKIKELYTFDGTTNIYSTDVVPPYLQIQYYMKGE